MICIKGNDKNQSCFYVICAMSGFWLATGIRASHISKTISISFISSIICFLVFSICPWVPVDVWFCRIFVTHFTHLLYNLIILNIKLSFLFLYLNLIII